MNFKEFEELVNSGVGEIALGEDVVPDEERNWVRMKKDGLTIDGNGHTIELKRFHVQAKNITLKNMDFVNNDEYSFRFEIDSKSSLTLIDCSFQDNRQFEDETDENPSHVIITHYGAVIDCEIYSKLALIGCDFEKCGINVSARLALVKIDNCRFDIENSKIANDDGSVEVVASQEEYLKPIIKEFTLCNRGLFLSLDEIPENYSRFSDLNELISCGEGEIVLNEDYIFDDSEELIEGIEIARDNLVIDGNNHIINGNGKSRVFDISAKNVTLKNIRFINSFSSDGGAIINRSEGLVLENCRFLGNHGGHGGAICNIGKNLRVIDCDFDFNSSFWSGGAIYSESDNLCIDSSSFQDNIVNDYFAQVPNFKSNLDGGSHGNGGAIYNERGRIHIKKTSFDFNQAMGEGSAIDNSGNMKAAECRFISNYAKDGAAVSNWGCFKADKSVFSGNESKYASVNNFLNMGTLELEDCQFEDGVYYENGDGSMVFSDGELVGRYDDEDEKNIPDCYEVGYYREEV